MSGKQGARSRAYIFITIPNRPLWTPRTRALHKKEQEGSPSVGKAVCASEEHCSSRREASRLPPLVLCQREGGHISRNIDWEEGMHGIVLQAARRHGHALRAHVEVCSKKETHAPRKRANLQPDKLRRTLAIEAPMPYTCDRIAVTAVAPHSVVEKALRVSPRTRPVIVMAVVWRRHGKENMIRVVLRPLRRDSDAHLAQVVVCQETNKIKIGYSFART